MTSSPLPRETAAARMECAGGSAAPPAAAPRISVAVATFRRPGSLRPCLAALASQTRPAFEVLVVARPDDAETRVALLAAPALGLPLRILPVARPGVVAAYNVALASFQGDVVAFTDDDAEPHPGWLEALATHFQRDARIGGVGGRDLLPAVHHAGPARVVGRVRWWGRWFGAHHLGEGPPRDVEALKGVNMAFRREAVAGGRFDERLLGAGAQEFADTEFSLRLGRAGWRLVYDPALLVDHHHALRQAACQRNQFDADAARDVAHNETLTLLEHLTPIRRVVFLAWAFLVGTGRTPGLVQWGRFLVRRQSAPAQRLLAGWRGRVAGWKTWRRSTRRAVRP